MTVTCFIMDKALFYLSIETDGISQKVFFKRHHALNLSSIVMQTYANDAINFGENPMENDDDCL